MSKGRRKRKAKVMENIPVALAKILIQIPEAKPSKKQLKEGMDKLYEGKADFDPSDVC